MLNARVSHIHSILTRSLRSTHTTGPARSFSTKYEHATIHTKGELPYGSREYILMPPNIPVAQKEYRLASIRAHRNILFNAKVYQKDDSLIEVAPALVQAALQDAQSQGEQPQAIATLVGLNRWVQACLEGRETSKVLATLDEISFEAIKAIATGVPRPGHEVVGPGTYRDGQKGWSQLATEYAAQAPEVALYEQEGAALVQIEHLADTNEEYLREAGGAMARLFFL